jgi:hypothetical protein
MIDRLGAAGIVGALLVVGGLALVAWKAPVVAAGLALVLIGLGLVVRGLVKGLMTQFGFV